MTRTKPEKAAAGKAKGLAALKQGSPQEAKTALLEALTHSPHDARILSGLGQAELQLGNLQQARQYLLQAVERDETSVESYYHLASTLHALGLYQEALQQIEAALALEPNNPALLERQALALQALFRFDEAISTLDRILQIAPQNYSYWNNAANLCRDMGQFTKAESYYLKSIALAGKETIPFSNYLTCLHYNPTTSREAIFTACKEWELRYAPRQIPPRPQPHDRTPGRRIRIGMFSDGFRNHPVGRMITPPLERLGKHEFELFAYSTNGTEDPLTGRIRQCVDHWTSIQHLSDEEFAQRIRDDGIDILIDLCGHNAGARMRTMALQPAPLLLKWVGGLINTTGLSSIDYLLTDTIESPDGEDEFYTENLIRMPDDYVCYAPPEYMPDISSLPALANGYITFGCFNNPSKVNEVVLREWAALMHELPESRLLLKGHQYNSKKLCQSVRQLMAANGIDEHRVLIEGSSPHVELLRTYNRVDIALDPWPYSGGLTTCEAFQMGVPVVSLPGPTFAGRHSATHLVNAGMPELVVQSWDEYRERAIELASDLDSLSTIRRHLREVLLQSPVCDASRFAANFTTAMRAIWQRYCEGKPPTALTLDQQGQAWFKGELNPEQLQHPQCTATEEAFSFTFDGKIIVLDHGGVLVGTPDFVAMQSLNAYATIAFDPASKIEQATLNQTTSELHHYPHVALGDGQEANLYACLDPAMSATLEPLPPEQLPEADRQAAQVIAKLPIPTLRLDDIEGLENIDWLLLDNMSASLTILENGKKALMNTLLIQARVNFVASHQQQPELAPISLWLTSHGFSLYRLNNLSHTSCFPPRDDLLQPQATQLAWADALFLPNEQRMGELPDNQRQKLAFLLHQVYGVKDLTYRLLATASPKIADNYLRMEGLLAPEATAPGPERTEGDPEVSVICATYNHRNYIEDAIKGFLAQKTDFKFEIIIHDDASTDGTQEIVTRYAEQYPELIRVILQTENQYSKNRKPADICLPKTKGRYIAMCEGDDYWVDPEKLQKQYDFMEANPNYSCCYHDAFIFNEVGIVSSSKLPKRYRKDYTRSELLLNNCFILTLSIFFRKTFSEYPKEKSQVGNGDNFLISMLGLYGKGKYLPDIAPAAYRLHGESTWSSKSLKEKNEMLRNSFTWIAHYHHREGRPDIADHYHKKAALLID